MLQTRIKKLETQTKSAREVAIFWRGLVNNPTPDDGKLSAAYLLTVAGVIMMPPMAIDKQMTDYLNSRMDSETSWSNFFRLACEQLDHEYFNDVETHPHLLNVACELLSTFKVAPQLITAKGCTPIELLRRHYLIAICRRVFPQYRNGYEHFETWLESDGILSPEQMLESAAAWMRDRCEPNRNETNSIPNRTPRSPARKVAPD